VAAADWESVGGAWTPESEGFAAERIESPGKQTRSGEAAEENWAEESQGRTESDTNCSVLTSDEAIRAPR